MISGGVKLDNFIEKYDKNNLSWFHIEQLIVMIICICGALILLHLRLYVLSVILFTCFVYFIYNYLKTPNSIEISNNGVLYGSTMILWSEMEFVEYKLSPGRDYRDTIIMIKVKNNWVCTIHTQLYKGCDQIKTTIKEYCNNNNIRFITKTRS